MKNKLVNLIQLYPEVGVSFDNLISNSVWYRWHEALNSNIKIEGKLKKYSNYSLTITITSSALINNLKVMGPTLGRRNKNIGYALWIPYSPVLSSSEPLIKLTDYFKSGVIEILRNLEYTEGSIIKVADSIK